METLNNTRVLSPNPYFAQVASEARINKVAEALKANGIGSGINKVLIINREFRPGRITAILVKENLGF
jgi:hypothetical protein